MQPGDHVETGFRIDGATYPVPDLSSFTMGERRVMYDTCGLVQEDFVQGEDETDEETDERRRLLMRHPGFIETLMHVAYQRCNPGVKRDAVARLIAGVNYVEAVETLADEPEEPGDAGPPGETSAPDGSLPSGSEDSNESSGGVSGNGSAAPDMTPEATGTGRSDTSFQASAPTT